MYIGIDLGTSGIKGILLNEQGAIVASHTEALEVSRPQPLWSEQDPEQWWQAAIRVFDAFSSQCDLSRVKALGLTGQMHGAVLLDAEGQVLRPAILWNDGRSYEQCRALEHQVPLSRQMTGNLMMPGFTAPKISWVREYEPHVFARIAKVLLPKDYLRFRLTHTYATDMSDAAGTLYFNVKKRDWCDDILTACGLTRQQMPRLYEGSEITGLLDPELAKRWHLPEHVAVVAGASDNAAGALGVGLTKPGQAMISLGTSGVFFVVSDGYYANPDKAVHSFCHALPQRWHLMSVILSAASCLKWVSQLVGHTDIPSLLQEINPQKPGKLLFLPYLSGERTPHNDPNAQGVFFGLTHETCRADLVRAVLEGVGFAFYDGIQVLESTGLKATDISLIGGGARSEVWRQILADIFNKTLSYREGGDVGPALGAARLAQIGVMGTSAAAIDSIFKVPDVMQVYTPDQARHDQYMIQYENWKHLYCRTKGLFH